MITIYADGASRGTVQEREVGSNISAFAFTVEDDVHERFEYAKAYINKTNNQMEIVAVLVALRSIKKYPKNTMIDVYTDSSYVVDTINKKWYIKWEQNGWTKKGGLKNAELWQQLITEIRKYPRINFYWVKGHAKNLGNNRVDRLCNEAMDSYY